MPRQLYGLGGLLKSITKGVKSAVKGVAKTVKKNPVLGLAALNFAPMLIPGGASTFFGGKSAMFGLPGFQGAKDFFTSGSKLSQMSKVGAAGGILTALLSQAEQGDEEAQALTRNIPALKGYLFENYKNLGYTDQQAQELTDKDTAEYTQDMARGQMANGGRIGYQEGGIEQRLEQLGGDVSSAEEMLKGINERLQSAESSLGSGGGGLGSLAGPNVGNEIAIPSRPGPFMGRPIMQPLLQQPLGQPLPTTLEAAQPGPNPFGIINSLTDPRGPAFDTMENAYKNAVDSSAEMKRIGRLDQLDVLGGRLSFEDYKKNFSMDDKGFVTRNPGSTPLGMQSQGGGMGSPIQQAVGMADGGRIGFAYGDTAEDNAMQASGIMGLPMNENPAGVKELDLRETGGFIPPVGVKEKADDIPAMLSNNEFVFTADAVRGMGDGNVNVGAQRMYDMMKKLENGGRV
jgi:hypothetical protein